MKLRILSAVTVAMLLITSLLSCDNKTNDYDASKSKTVTSIELYNELSAVYNAALKEEKITVSDAFGGSVTINPNALHIILSGGKEIWYGTVENGYFEATRSPTYNGEPAMQTYRMISEVTFRSQIEYYRENALADINEMMNSIVSSDTFEGLKTAVDTALYQAKGSEIVSGIYTEKFFYQLVVNDGLPVKFSNQDYPADVTYSFGASIILPNLDEFQLINN